MTLLMKQTTKLLIIVLILVFGCTSSKQLNKTNLADLYSFDNKFTSLECEIFHINDSISSIFIPVSLYDLDYRKHDILDIYMANYSINYKLLSAYESKEIIDSATVFYNDSTNFGKETRLLQILNIKARYPGRYILELELKDENSLASVHNFYDVNKSRRGTAQDFLLLGEGNQPLFRNYLEANELFKIRLNQHGVDNLNVKVFKKEYPIAEPPFTPEQSGDFNYIADSTFTVLVNGNETAWQSLDSKGIYQFQINENSREGISLFRFQDDFPWIDASGQMIYPLRYITTLKEYNKLLAASSKKDAVDNFWMETAGNHLRAKNLISKYYNNVEDANLYFTSYLEGWKTDRGLIYTVFGKPNIVYRGYKKEEWIYGEAGNRNSINFTFVYMSNPFSENDYRLLKTPTYKDSWYLAVDNWRR